MLAWILLKKKEEVQVSLIFLEQDVQMGPHWELVGLVGCWVLWVFAAKAVAHVFFCRRRVFGGRCGSQVGWDHVCPWPCWKGQLSVPQKREVGARN